MKSTMLSMCSLFRPSIHIIKLKRRHFSFTGFVSLEVKESTQEKIHWSSVKPTLPCPICSRRFRDEGVLNTHIGFNHSRMISDALRQNPIESYKNIFGEEEIKSITNKEMRYSNGLVITLTGEFQGYWYSFIGNEGGGPLRALKFKEDLSVAQAAIRGLELLRSLDTTIGQQLFKRPKAPNLSLEERNAAHKKLQKLKIDVAQNIWATSVDLKGSVGEKYLVKHRKIDKKFIDRLDFRFLPKGAVYKDYKDDDFVEVSNPCPALLVGVENSDGELTGVQRIFLDPNTFAKPKWMTRNKFSRGILQGSAGIVRRGVKGRPVYVAEGPETASSIIASHLHSSPDCPVLASLSLSNVLNLMTFLKSLNPTRVIFAADNDGADSIVTQKSLQIYRQLSKSLLEHSIPMNLVSPPGSEKCDWNDVLKTEGLLKTRKIFREQLRKSEDLVDQ